MNLVGAMSQCIQGSPNLYAGAQRGPAASINFITCHDGFTLYDLVAYNGKHNEANGENNNDGANDNESWNCGWEGDSTDPAVNELRWRQVRNALTMLFVSQGVPMILMGDEMGRTQYGNNNTYCHDNELNWLDWSLLKKNAPLFRFTKQLIAFRNAHPVLRGRTHLRNQNYLGSGGIADISWHGTQAWNADWSDSSRVLAFMLCGEHAREGAHLDNLIYVAMNMHPDGAHFQLPIPPNGLAWHVSVNTGSASPDDSWAPGCEPRLDNQGGIWLSGRSIAVLIGK